MCPPDPVPLLGVSFSEYSSDEDIVLFLAKSKAMDPHPQSDFKLVHISAIDPWDLKENTWYFNRQGDQRCSDGGIERTRNGYWKPIDALKVHISAAISGLKMTLEFYEGQPPSGKKTAWMMHEYLVELSENTNVPQVNKTLCRVILQGDKRIMNAENSDYVLESYVQDLSKTQEEVLESVTSKKQNDLSIVEENGQICSTKIKRPGRRLCRKKICCLHPKVLCRKLANKSKFRMCEPLVQMIDAILLDLIMVKHKINQDKNKILSMEQKVEGARGQHLASFSNERGQYFRRIVGMAANNENILRCINKHANMLSKTPRTSAIANRISSQIKGLDEENKALNTLACFLLQTYNKLDLRIHEEEAWMEKCEVYLKELFATVGEGLAELQRSEAEALKLKVQLAEFMRYRTSIHVLHEVIEALERIELCLKSSSRQLELTNAKIKSSESILNSKVGYFSCCAEHKKKLKEIYEKIKPGLVGINNRIAPITNMYGVKVAVEPNHEGQESFNPDEYAFNSLKNHEMDLCFSWRTRKFHNRPILSPVRTQSDGTCSYNATLSMVESLYKREYAAYPTILKDKIGQPDEFLIDLSREQLEDIVQDFKSRHKKKGSERLNICLDRMKYEGVVSEEAYRTPQLEPVDKYKIKDFEKIDVEMEKQKSVDLLNTMDQPHGQKKRRKFVRRKKKIVVKNIYEVIKSHMVNGKVLVANFRVTTGYFRLLPHDIYRIPERNAQYEVNKKGVPVSHCVVVVGFGLRNGEAYLIYQNSYGKCWGLDGFGRIYLDSVRLLYLAQV